MKVEAMHDCRAVYKGRVKVVNGISTDEDARDQIKPGIQQSSKQHGTSMFPE